MAEYQNERNRKYKGGEWYMSASLDYALRQNGFQVDVLHKQRRKIHGKIAQKYHRVFLNGNDWSEHFHTTTRTETCKVRAFHWWGGGNEKAQSPLDPKQRLTPFPQSSHFNNTFLGFFPHSLLYQQQQPLASRQKVGLLLGKSPEYFENHEGLISALLADNFTLHTTCKDSKKARCSLPPSVIRHHKVGPITFANLLPQFAFMLGLGKPLDSPSPLEGLANGVAFLNPILRDDMEAMPSIGATQNNAMAALGMPYVYNVHLKNYTQVVAAANRAVDNRFSSYTPREFTPEAMISRVCGILEDDALCE